MTNLRDWTIIGLRKARYKVNRKSYQNVYLASTALEAAKLAPPEVTVIAVVEGNHYVAFLVGIEESKIEGGY